MVHTEHFNAM